MNEALRATTWKEWLKADARLCGPIRVIAVIMYNRMKGRFLQFRGNCGVLANQKCLFSTLGQLVFGKRAS